MSDEEFEIRENLHMRWRNGEPRNSRNEIPEQFKVYNRDLTELSLLLDSVILSNIDIKDSNLSGLSFQNSVLIDCNFAGCDLSNCNFKNANLAGTIFAGATLTNANFESSIMNGTYLAGAKFTVELSKVDSMKNITCEREQLQYLIHNEDFLFSQKYTIIPWWR